VESKKCKNIAIGPEWGEERAGNVLPDTLGCVQLKTKPREEIRLGQTVEKVDCKEEKRTGG